MNTSRLSHYATATSDRKFINSYDVVCIVFIERCSEIEKHNRQLLERMTNILAGPVGFNSIKNQSARIMPPIYRANKTSQV